jgi:hypothetical protein
MRGIKMTQTTFTFDKDLFSDLHKDAYGFRPRNHSFYILCETDPEEAQVIWDMTLKDLEEECKRIEQREKEAIEEFNQWIQELISLGAGDRETAIRWIISTYDGYDTPGYICYDLGLPYSYEKEFEKGFCTQS